MVWWGYVFATCKFVWLFLSKITQKLPDGYLRNMVEWSGMGGIHSDDGVDSFRYISSIIFFFHVSPLFSQSMSEEKYRPLTSRLLVGRPRWKLLFDEIGRSNKKWVAWERGILVCIKVMKWEHLTPLPSPSMVSVSEWGFSAVDRGASPGLCTNYATPADPLEQSLNSTRSHSADWTSEHFPWRKKQQLWDGFYTFINIQVHFWRSLDNHGYIKMLCMSRRRNKDCIYISCLLACGYLRPGSRRPYHVAWAPLCRPANPWPSAPHAPTPASDPIKPLRRAEEERLLLICFSSSAAGFHLFPIAPSVE